jgi:hypothetical protein
MMTEGDRERRLAITYIVLPPRPSVWICYHAGWGGRSPAAPKAGSKQVEIVDDYIVIHSSTTTLVPVDP